MSSQVVAECQTAAALVPITVTALAGSLLPMVGIQLLVASCPCPCREVAIVFVVVACASGFLGSR